jgi:hypothetical protein
MEGVETYPAIIRKHNENRDKTFEQGVKVGLMVVFY